MKPLKSVPQSAELCGISTWTVRSYIRQGKLRPVRIGRRVLLEEEELERFIRGTVAKPESSEQSTYDAENGEQAHNV